MGLLCRHPAGRLRQDFPELLNEKKDREFLTDEFIRSRRKHLFVIPFFGEFIKAGGLVKTRHPGESRGPEEL